MVGVFQKQSDAALTLYLYVENIGTPTAVNCTVEMDLTAGLLLDYGTFDYVTYPSAAITLIQGREIFLWTVGDLTGKLLLVWIEFRISF